PHPSLMSRGRRQRVARGGAGADEIYRESQCHERPYAFQSTCFHSFCILIRFPVQPICRDTPSFTHCRIIVRERLQNCFRILLPSREICYRFGGFLTCSMISSRSRCTSGSFGDNSTARRL